MKKLTIWHGWLRGLWSVSLTCLSLLTSCDDDADEQLLGPDYGLVAPYCRSHVGERLGVLRRVASSGQADMLFITDTHYSDNELASPGILRYLTRQGVVRRVVWGGDAITAYGDVAEEWRLHERDFCKAVAPAVPFYAVRGNHEFTAKDELRGTGLTYSQARTATLLSQQIAADAVRPSDDPEACYYYVDDAERRLRYCVFDTTDSIASTSEPWATVLHTSQRQLDWMDRHALHNVPEGWDLVVITHVGVAAETYGQHAPLEPLRQLLAGAGARVLMVVSGHRHQDFQTYDQGMLHVLTGADAYYELDLRNSPFMHKAMRRRRHYTAQLMDLFVVSPDHRTIHAIRIGAGGCRTFHLDTLFLPPLSMLDLPPLTALDTTAAVQWTAYDATGYACPDAPWDPPSTRLGILPSSRMLPIRPGTAVLMATDRHGDREFYQVVCDPFILPDTGK